MPLLVVSAWVVKIGNSAAAAAAAAAVATLLLPRETRGMCTVHMQWARQAYLEPVPSRPVSQLDASADTEQQDGPDDGKVPFSRAASLMDSLRFVYRACACACVRVCVCACVRVCAYAHALHLTPVLGFVAVPLQVKHATRQQRCGLTLQQPHMHRQTDR